MIDSTNIKIVPLSKVYLKEASKLVNLVFDDEDSKPSKELKASLSPSSFNKYRKYTDSDILSLEYFVALDCNRVVGLTGIYTLKEDFKYRDWIGWYCVNPKDRGKNIGKLLLEFTINVSKERNKKYLSLYTSTSENERNAQFLYEKYGFFITHVEKEDGYDLLYRQKIL